MSISTLSHTACTGWQKMIFRCGCFDTYWRDAGGMPSLFDRYYCCQGKTVGKYSFVCTAVDTVNTGIKQTLRRLHSMNYSGMKNTVWGAGFRTEHLIRWTATSFTFIHLVRNVFEDKSVQNKHLKIPLRTGTLESGGHKQTVDWITLARVTLSSTCNNLRSTDFSPSVMY